MIRAGLLLAALTLHASGAAAFSCSEPETPSCATWYDQFENPYELESCQRDMETYKDKAEDYGKCLKDEAEKAEKAVKKAMEDFQRRAAKGVASPQ